MVNPPTTHLRPGRPGDAGACAAVHVRCWQQSYADLVPSADLARLDPGERVPRWRAGLAEGTVVVAEAAGELVGLAAVRPPDELALLYLDVGAQGIGLGRQLHDAALALLPAGVVPALWVLEGNARARAFYAARGWSPTGERQQVDVAGTSLVELRMRRDLPAPSEGSDRPR